MSATDQPKSVVSVPEAVADDLCERLEDLLTGNDQMHPVGCSEWEDRARVAVDMAKDFIRRAQSPPAPQGDGSGAAKLIAYEDAHAVAVELGYPSLTEALEALAISPHHTGDVTNMICTGAGWTVAQTVSQLEQEAARDGLPVSTVHRLKVAATTIAALSAPISGEGDHYGGVTDMIDGAAPTYGKGELLPCPFCGGSDLRVGGDDKWVGACCLTCGAVGPDHYGSSNDWNRRAPAYGKGEREAVARIIDPAAFMFSADELGDKVYSASRAHAFDRADRILQALQLGRE